MRCFLTQPNTSFYLITKGMSYDIQRNNTLTSTETCSVVGATACEGSR